MSAALVLNTRAREQAGELSRLLRAAGFEVVEAPAIATVSSWEPTELEAVRRGLREGLYAWVVLASQNAAHGLEGDLRAARIACGTATAAALGLQPELAVERFSAAAVLDALRPALRRGERVLVPHAAEGRDELVDGLRGLGAVVDAPIAYRTVAVESAADRLRAGDIDVVTLCSPSAARSVASAVGADTLVVCLGETTAAQARECALAVHAVAGSTSMPALVAAVQSALGVRV